MTNQIDVQLSGEFISPCTAQPIGSSFVVVPPAGGTES
jgi:hypothetical protein